MIWIVLGEENNKIKLVSKNNVQGILPKGSYLTVEDRENKDVKFILRVDKTNQGTSYTPEPMIIDMNLSPLKQDQKCNNLILAYRVKTIAPDNGGLVHYIKPLSEARRSTQEEVDLAVKSSDKGIEVFPATVYAGENQILTDDKNNFISVKLPEELFFHQTLVCGKTGQGKTVALKYLAQYFIEEMEGAVLAINVKDVDLLKLNQSSKSNNNKVLKEWKELKKKPHGVTNFTVYHPSNTNISATTGVDAHCQKVTLNIKELEPEALTGLLHGITDRAAESLPNIFRYWKEESLKINQNIDLKFGDFVNYFGEAQETRVFETLTIGGENSSIPLHTGTYQSIRRVLDVARDFFADNDADAISINEEDILQRGKMSVIQAQGENGLKFGSIILRDLLRRIVKAKSDQTSNIPVLIMIDEVHRFWNTNDSAEALGALDTICREGRSQKIGVLFSSQNPTDIPSGLKSVINTKIFFNSDVSSAKNYGLTISSEEMETLEKGFSITSIYDRPQLKVLKFPLALAGVNDMED